MTTGSDRCLDVEAKRAFGLLKMLWLVWREGRSGREQKRPS